jgi:hypothetical protein
VGWIYQPVKMIETVAYGTRWGHQIDKHDTPADAADSHHLGHCSVRIGEVMQ